MVGQDSPWNESTDFNCYRFVGCGPPKPPDISIHQAAGGGDIEAVKQHLAAGTNVNTKNIRAAGYGHKEIVELLIAAGAEVNAKDKFGKTPLDYAIGEIADLLRKYGGKT